MLENRPRFPRSRGHGSCPLFSSSRRVTRVVSNRYHRATHNRGPSPALLSRVRFLAAVSCVASGRRGASEGADGKSHADTQTRAAAGGRVKVLLSLADVVSTVFASNPCGKKYPESGLEHEQRGEPHQAPSEVVHGAVGDA